MSLQPDQTNLTKPEEPLVGDRFSTACTCGLIMYACAAGYGAYFVIRSTSTPSMYLGVILGLPAVATVLFLLTSFAVPSLLAPRRMAFPLNLTLPFVYAAFVVLTVMLLTSTGSSLIIPFDRLRAAEFWKQPAVLALVTFSQIVCLTALTKLNAEPVD